MSGNAFLAEFIKMRQSQVAIQSPTPLAHSPATKEKQPRKKKEKMTSEQTRLNPGFQTIIEEKPAKKIVVDYLQKKANEFTIEKMK